MDDKYMDEIFVDKKYLRKKIVKYIFEYSSVYIEKWKFI